MLTYKEMDASTKQQRDARFGEGPATRNGSQSDVVPGKVSGKFFKNGIYETLYEKSTD